MNKPVDTIAFWNKRIENAEATGKIGYSVYMTDDWGPIDKAHETILRSHIVRDDFVLEAGCGYGRSVDLINSSTYIGVDQVPRFIEIAKAKEYWNSTNKVNFFQGVLPQWLDQFNDNWFDWTVCISLMVMIISNLGWGEWDKIQTELLRVSKEGVLCLEYTDPEVYHLIRSN